MSSVSPYCPVFIVPRLCVGVILSLIERYKSVLDLVTGCIDVSAGEDVDGLDIRVTWGNGWCWLGWGINNLWY